MYNLLLYNKNSQLLTEIDTDSYRAKKTYKTRSGIDIYFNSDNFGPLSNNNQTKESNGILIEIILPICPLAFN